MKIGLISDTHGFLDAKVFDYFKECEEVWHAGDVGDMRIVEALEGFRRLRAVFGNIDDKEMQNRLPEDLWFECEQMQIWMTHIGGVPPRYNQRVKKILQTRAPDIFICGHSHILRVGKDPAHGDMLYMNPGAAGNQGFHHMKTILRFEIVAKEIRNLEAIDLGRRGLTV